MNVFGRFAAQVKLYEAQVQAYAAQVDIAHQVFANNLRKFFGSIPKQENSTMSDARKEVFSVYTAANGYYAELPNGSIVVGTTLSEVCEAAQAAAAACALANDEEYNGVTAQDPLGQMRKQQWTKVR